ncbi:MAG: ABC transporter ATP-binding protein, partial [Cellulosilyticum sp.]|nr:ABC transporter ATP-binding protein [Cellulosilyticum sp.]
MKKKNHFKSLSLKYSYWLIAFGIVCVGYNSITVKGVDLISNAVDQMLAGSKVLMGPLLSKLIIMIIGGTVLAFLRKCCNRMYSLNIETDIKNKSVTHIETLAYSYFDQAGTGSILTKLSTDMREVEGLFSNMIPAGISETITALIIGSYFFNISKILLLGVLIIYPAVFGMTKILSNKYRSLERHKRKKMDFITEIIQDSLGGIAIIKSYNLFEPLKERLNQAADAVVENEKERTKLAATMGYVMGITRWVPIILCCSIALHECIKGKMSVGEVMSFTILLDQFVIAMSELPIIFTGIQEKRVPLE